MRQLSFLLVVLMLVVPASGDITFTVAHTDNGGGWTDPTLGKARRDTLTAVLAYLNTVLDHNGVIDYRTGQSDYNETGPVASAPTGFLLTPNGFSSGNAFLHATTGVDPNPGSADATITVDWGYSLSTGLGQPAPGELDLFTVLLHEVTHGLGFLTRINTNGTSAVTGTDPGVYTVMDSFARIGNVAPATPLLAAGGNFTASPADLSDFSPGIFYWGPAGVAANSGKPLKLTQGSPHTLGSGLSHTGLLMGSSLSTSEIYRTYSVRDLGMLRDLGWKIKKQNPVVLGPVKIALLKDTGPGGGPPIDDLNAGTGGSRFRGTLGGILIDTEPAAPRRVYEEDPSTGEGSGRTQRNDYTQLNHPDAPGSIALTNRDGSHSWSGLTWISPAENFRMPARSDEKFVVAFRANPDPGIGETGTFLDVVVGAPGRELPGGAELAKGIGVRLNVSGPHDGRWQIFDGTGLVPRVEASGPLPRPLLAESSNWHRVAVELLEPSFDGATPTAINVLIDGAVVHTFTSAGAIGDNYVSFQAGPSADPGQDAATYLLDDIEISIEPWADAPAVVSVASGTLEGSVGVPYAASFTANGGTAPYEWWLEGTLPAGLSFQDGAITGTPSQPGTFSITVSAVDYGFFVGKTTRAIVIGGKPRRRPASSGGE